MASLSDLHGQRVFLDTNIIVHIVEGFAPFALVLQQLLAAVEAGQVTAIMSELSVAECLVKPLADGSPKLAAIYESFIVPGPSREVVQLSRPVLRQAAAMRAMTSLKLPDAIQVAAAASGASDVFLTRDKSIRGGSVPIVLLDAISVE